MLDSSLKTCARFVNDEEKGCTIVDPRQETESTRDFVANSRQEMVTGVLFGLNNMIHHQQAPALGVIQTFDCRNYFQSC